MLENKVAFVTGGASGIGRSVAIRFAKEGANVGIADVAEPEGCEVCAEVQKNGRQALYQTCDVSDPEQVRLAIEATVKKFGRLDIVVANAGINGVWAPIDELHPSEWDKTLNINLKGTYLTVHYAIPHLKRAGGGSVIITSSVNGTRTFSNAGATAYSTSKAGQIAFMKMAALELGRDNIRVNAICPGAIHTNINESIKRRHTEKLEIKVELPEGNPAIDGGQGEPEEVADVCLFLASDMSRHVSGVEIFVDGGVSLLR